jgi:hypothetical protein
MPQFLAAWKEWASFRRFLNKSQPPFKQQKAIAISMTMIMFPIATIKAIKPMAATEVAFAMRNKNAVEYIRFDVALF